MNHYEYVIVGGGMAADAAVKGIREIDGSSSIVVISMEPDPPYTRPMLSKKLWQGKPLESIWRGTGEAGADLRLGRRVETLDPVTRSIRDDRGDTYEYGKLLLATGGTPRRIAGLPQEIIYFRSLEHYRQLRALADRGTRLGIIGGGFIGSELAASLAMIGKEVVIVLPEDALCSRVFPRDISRFLNEYYREKGVEVLAGDSVTGVERQGPFLLLQTGSGRLISTDAIVAGIGIDLNLDLARQAGCTVGNGVEVDRFLQAAPHIYAAGDIASFHYEQLGGRYRFEHEDNAVTMGRHAGRNMAGAAEPYRHLPYFYSDMFDLGYEAVGELDSRLDTVADWSEPYRKGVVYYLREGKVRGVLLWNVWDQVPAARAIIEAGETVTASDLKGRFPA